MIWQILQHRGEPGKIINRYPDVHIVGFECQMIHDGSLTEPFQARTGVRQGCVLWLILFFVVLD